MTMTPIPPLDRTSPTFRNEVDTFFATRIPTMVTEANALEANVNAKEIATSEDAIATAGDRVQTGQDRIATGQDRYQTGQDRIQTGQDRAAAAASAATIGTMAAFSDTNPVVKGSADATKQVRFEVDGLTTGTTRVITVPNKSGTLAMLDDGASFKWLGRVVPTAGASNIDFLSICTADYDSYLIVGRDLAPSDTSLPPLCFRLANGGVADATTVYCAGDGGTGTTGSGATETTLINTSILTDGLLSASFELRIHNTNSTTGVKAFFSHSMATKTTPVITSLEKFGVYHKTAAVSGIRIFWNGITFAARGSVEVYGLKNS